MSFLQAGVPAPAVSFCPHSSNYGWKNSTNLAPGEFISSFCSEARPEAVERCVRENTFPFNMKQNVMNSSLWSSSMAMVYAGLCHTFNYPRPLSADINTDSFLFYLDPSLSYRIIIHDPKFYHLVTNTIAFPRIWLEYKFGDDPRLQPGHYQHCGILLTQHHLLNRPEQPCEEEEDYDFLKCVKTSQARLVGCRPPWDIWSPPSIPLCQTMEQLQQHEQLDQSYIQIEQQKIVNQTGCNIPCKFKVCDLR